MTDPAQQSRDKALRAQAALDGELDAANTLAFEQDLERDPELRRAYETARAASAATRAALAREKAPDALRARVLGLVERRQSAPRPPRAPRARRLELALAASLAVAAFLAGAGADRFWGGAANDREAETLVADFARGEIAGQPFDVASSDRHTVKPWLANRVAIGVAAVDLADQGFPLAGGRIDIFAHAPVPTLVYRRREHFIAVSELPRDGAAAERTATVDGYPIERWSDEERAYVAVSDLDRAELSGFVKAFRQKVAAARGQGE
jgi:anti-sigma factor RsiW